jgi:hypothetical protein
LPAWQGGCRANALPAEADELCFYAGSLRRLPDQRPLGTRCLIDRRPRTSTSAAQQVLDLLAALISQDIARRLTYLAQPRAAPSRGIKPAPSYRTSWANSPSWCATPSPATASRFPYPPSGWPRSNAACSICSMGLPSGRANEPSGRTFTRRNRPSRGPLTEQIQQGLTGPRKGAFRYTALALAMGYE